MRIPTARPGCLAPAGNAQLAILFWTTHTALRNSHTKLASLVPGTSAANHSAPDISQPDSPKRRTDETDPSPLARGPGTC
ncbi:hypothetical protein V500_04474 [Pseudogymnoascus sp. VKM F-4518 (FW-2643)]|nr:hypothetical protein V500_04474 [Pseudogymnoascus sp. VKM F-4518 (FW-2643)]